MFFLPAVLFFSCSGNAAILYEGKRKPADQVAIIKPDIPLKLAKLIKDEWGHIADVKAYKKVVQSGNLIEADIYQIDDIKDKDGVEFADYYMGTYNMHMDEGRHIIRAGVNWDFLDFQGSANGVTLELNAEKGHTYFIGHLHKFVSGNRVAFFFMLYDVTDLKRIWPETVPAELPDPDSDQRLSPAMEEFL